MDARPIIAIAALVTTSITFSMNTWRHFVARCKPQRFAQQLAQRRTIYSYGIRDPFPVPEHVYRFTRPAATASQIDAEFDRQWNTLLDIKPGQVMVDVDACDSDRLTLLHRAVIERRYEIAEYLLSKGAKSTAKDAWGNTPLDFADCSDRCMRRLVAERHDRSIS